MVILNDELLSLTHEIIRADALGKINLGLDFFDASINRIGAYVIGARATLKAFLIALLEPKKLKEIEESGENFKRIAILEELKTMPFGVIWDYYCWKNQVPTGLEWIDEVYKYEKEILN